MSPDLSLIYCLWPGCGRVFLQLFMAAIFCCRSYGEKKKKNAVLEVMLWKIFFIEGEEAIFYPHITSLHPLPSHGHNNPSLRDPPYRERWPPGFYVTFLFTVTVYNVASQDKWMREKSHCCSGDFFYTWITEASVSGFVSWLWVWRWLTDGQTGQSSTPLVTHCLGWAVFKHADQCVCSFITCLPGSWSSSVTEGVFTMGLSRNSSWLPYTCSLKTPHYVQSGVWQLCVDCGCVCCLAVFFFFWGHPGSNPVVFPNFLHGHVWWCDAGNHVVSFDFDTVARSFCALSSFSFTPSLCDVCHWSYFYLHLSVLPFHGQVHRCWSALNRPVWSRVYRQNPQRNKRPHMNLDV